MSASIPIPPLLEAKDAASVGACDNCGRARQDRDETLCRSCKPVLALRAELADCEAKCDAAYWRFTRQARAKPPSVAEPAAWARRTELRALLGVTR
jgi:hypothetical protein